MRRQWNNASDRARILCYFEIKYWSVKLCLHVTSACASASASKFNIESMVTQIHTRREWVPDPFSEMQTLRVNTSTWYHGYHCLRHTLTHTQTLTCKQSLTTWSVWFQMYSARTCLHQASVSTQSQRYDDAYDIALIEKNGVAEKWVETPLLSNSSLFPLISMRAIGSAIAAFTLC